MATSSTVGTSDGYEAKEILRDYYAILASSISDPVQVSKDLFQEKVIIERDRKLWTNHQSKELSIASLHENEHTTRSRQVVEVCVFP